jgi:glycosyltransferase involved in cell wall biosynthesis
MPEASFGNALVTSNVRLTGTDGKSIRLLHVVDLLNSLGFKVILVINKCNLNTPGPCSIIETKIGLNDNLSDGAFKKVFFRLSQFIKLFSFYAKLLVLDLNCKIVVSSLEGLQTDSFFACLLSKFKRIPFIYDYDDPSPEILRSAWERSYFGRRILAYLPRIAERFLCTSSSLTFVPNESMRQLISRSVKTNKLVVLYNTVSKSADFDHLLFDVKKTELGLPQHKMIISYIGLIKAKSYRIDDLLKLFSQIDPELREKIQLVFVGPQDINIVDMIRHLKLEDCACYIGCVGREKAISILKLSSLSIIPIPLWGSITAPITKFFESMSIGIPILTIKTNEIQGILGKKYPYYYDYTVNNLEQALRSALTDQDKLKVVGEEIKKLFDENYNWEHHKKELLHVLRHKIHS